MPSGAKKRKAAKRRKEQEQQQGARPPGSLTSASTGPSSSQQGNGLREEDDLTSHDGKGSDSGSDVASPTAQGNHHHVVEIAEEVLMGGRLNGGKENPSESSGPQSMEEAAKETGDEVAVAVAASVISKDGNATLSPSDHVLHKSVEIPISEPEAVCVEHIRSDKDKDVPVSGEVPSQVELKQSEALDSADLVEQPVHIPSAEEAIRATGVPVENLVVVNNMAVAPTDRKKEKLVPPAGATSKELNPTVESHPGTRSYGAKGSCEIVSSAHAEQRASWLSCCGLFDVLASASK